MQGRRKNRFVGILIFVLLLIILAMWGLRAIQPSGHLRSSGLEIRFLDVGQGDASLILCGGKAALIDGGKPECSSLLYNTLEKLGIRELEAIICTHPDLDHVGGLAGALNYAKVRNAYCCTDQSDAPGFQSFLKYLNKQNVKLTVPKAGDSFFLAGAECTFIGPVTASDNDNDNSLVLSVCYDGVTVLFAGDAEYDEEQSILDSRSGLKCDVLKIGHHGSRTSTSARWLEQLAPQYAVISVGSNNSYGHPSEQVLSLLAESGTAVYRTDLQGTVILRCDSNHISFTTEKNVPVEVPETTAAPTVPVQESAPGQVTYVCNQRSKKFHLPECSGVATMSEKNRRNTTQPRDELIAQGYTPCGSCNP